MNYIFKILNTSSYIRVERRAELSIYNQGDSRIQVVVNINLSVGHIYAQIEISPFNLQLFSGEKMRFIVDEKALSTIVNMLIILLVSVHF